MGYGDCAEDRDGNPKRKKLLKPCTADNKHSYEVTTGFVLEGVALLIIQGAHFATQKRLSKKMWRKAPYGIDLPYIHNSMTSMTYEFIRSYIHFVWIAGKNGMPKITMLSTGTAVTQPITQQPFTPSATTCASSVGLLTVLSILVMLFFVLLLLLELVIQSGINTTVNIAVDTTFKSTLQWLYSTTRYL
jgi:hypothetical protein